MSGWSSPELWNNSLVWQWAVLEQLHLYDRHDAKWIDQAAQGWPSDEEFKSFMKAYGVRRGKLGSSIMENSKKIRDTLHELFESKNDDPKSLGEIWLKSVEILKRHGLVPHRPYSFTSKLLWLYHPAHFYMFDRFARVGLKEAVSSRAKVDVNSYIGECDSLFKDDNTRRQINSAVEGFSRRHPFPRRILDKRLWLLGRGDERQTLERLKSAVNALPFAQL